MSVTSVSSNIKPVFNLLPHVTENSVISFLVQAFLILVQTTN
jgi:hypothetical protein